MRRSYWARAAIIVGMLAAADLGLFAALSHMLR
jgi:hypothetical protein